MKKTLPLAVALFATLCSSCLIVIDDGGASVHGFGSHSSNSKTIRGSGTLAEEEREVAAFTSVRLSGDIDVHVQVGPELSLTIEGEDNLLTYVNTVVEGNELRVFMDDGSYNFRKPLVVHVQVPSLRAVSLSGSGEMIVSGVDGGSFDVNLIGSGDVILKDLKADVLDVTLVGSGEISGAGVASVLKISMAGSGDIDFAKVRVNNASAGMSGSGGVRLHAVQALNVNMSGSCEVGYKGNPKITKNLSGSCEVYSFN